MKKKEMPLNEFLQSEEYTVLHDNLQQELNHNNITFNEGIRKGDKFVQTLSNTIHFKHRREQFIKNEHEKALIKDMKRKNKSKAFNLVAKREELLNNFMTYTTNNKMPNWNLKIQIS